MTRIFISLALLFAACAVQAGQDNRSTAEFVRDYAFTYTAAATAFRLCTSNEVGWNAARDQAAWAETETEMKRRGIGREDFDAAYKVAHLERHLYDYYKSSGIRRLLRAKDFGSGTILNATPEPRTGPDFCALALNELKAGTGIGTYFIAR